nr:MAG TPA: hypothetical protein [Caudoviricetes sp.]
MILFLSTTHPCTGVVWQLIKGLDRFITLMEKRLLLMGFVVILEVDRTGGDAMKQKTPEQKLKGLCANIIRERNHWSHINEYGCNDPFWPDGCNMNLTRNHIISYKRDIAELCEENGMPLPEEYFLKIPPEVDDNYMANLK